MIPLRAYFSLEVIILRCVSYHHLPEIFWSSYFIVRVSTVRGNRDTRSPRTHHQLRWEWWCAIMYTSFTFLQSWIISSDITVRLVSAGRAHYVCHYSDISQVLSSTSGIVIIQTDRELIKCPYHFLRKMTKYSPMVLEPGLLYSFLWLKINASSKCEVAKRRLFISLSASEITNFYF